AIAFKIESHNHPSAVEPFQGAATGVGGIIRDIFTMGARPICALNSLRFGPITENDGNSGAGSPAVPSPGLKQANLPGAGNAGQLPSSDEQESGNARASAVANNRRLFAGVVSGIAHYGNCFGIPTIGGEVYFDK